MIKILPTSSLRYCGLSVVIHTLCVSSALGLVMGNAGPVWAQAQPVTADCTDADALLKELTNKIKILEMERKSLKTAPLSSFSELKTPTSMVEGKEMRSSKYQIDLLEKENADLRARINELEIERAKIPPVSLDDVTDPGEKEALKRDLAEQNKKAGNPPDAKESAKDVPPVPAPPKTAPEKQESKTPESKRPEAAAKDASESPTTAPDAKISKPAPPATPPAQPQPGADTIKPETKATPNTPAAAPVAAPALTQPAVSPQPGNKADTSVKPQVSRALPLDNTQKPPPVAAAPPISPATIAPASPAPSKAAPISPVTTPAVQQQPVPSSVMATPPSPVQTPAAQTPAVAGGIALPPPVPPAPALPDFMTVGAPPAVTPIGNAATPVYPAPIALPPPIPQVQPVPATPSAAPTPLIPPRTSKMMGDGQ